MKSKTIGYSESKEFVDYSTGLKTWRKVWYECEPNIIYDVTSKDMVISRENPDEVFQQVKQKVQEWLSQSSQKENSEGKTFGSGENVFGQPMFHPPTQERPSGAAGIIQDIQSVIDLKVLESYRLLASNNPEIYTAYKLKLEELSK